MFDTPRSKLASALGACTWLVCGGALAQAPSPFELASQADLECRRASAVPPPADALPLSQLNPELIDVLHNQTVQLGALEDLCLPVAKNQAIPSEPTLQILRWTDLACYRARGEPEDAEIDLSHLNPVLADLPDETVRVTELEQVCLPVRKNDSQIPEAVQRFVEYFDFACYGLEEPTLLADEPLTLTHLNPEIIDLQFPERDVIMKRAHQLCVPIRKGNQNVPQDVLARLRWMDFLKYRLRPAALADAAAAPPFPLELWHLNPWFANLPAFDVTVGRLPKLLVPVAKNGQLPPGLLAGPAAPAP